MKRHQISFRTTVAVASGFLAGAVSSPTESSRAVGEVERQAPISFLLGNQQQFRFRHGHINILGHINEIESIDESYYRVNCGDKMDFYIKGTDEEKDALSRNRLPLDGDFNLEIPVNSRALNEGRNELRIYLADSGGSTRSTSMHFTWDPEPIPLPLDLRDLSDVSDIQDIGQIVNGAWEVDPKKNVIRSKAPISKDALLLLGSPHGSQEATYSVRFGGTTSHPFQFQGLSDFFAGHEATMPPIGINPGWSSAGLATIRPTAGAQAWLAWGDLLLDDDRRWAVKTEPPRELEYQQHEVYHVRHQVVFQAGINSVRFKLWPDGEEEPDEWLCQVDDAEIADDKTKHEAGSFGLFQFYSQPTEWFNILIKQLDSPELEEQ